ncbi:hypothetical protein ACOYW6_12465 [Parablastomonas sp. CN1-191]|uniref:hypothetical protein n=1 Tax=Parablastomonas sp. CN1-191 TaxID=3400908 RepID=UPI003BF89FEE
MNARQIVTGAILGGALFGAFLGMTTPTAMATHAEDDWRARLPTTQVATLVQPDQVAYNFGTPESVAPEFNIYHGIDAAERDRYIAFQREQDDRFARLQSEAEAQVTRAERESARAEAAAMRADAARADAAAAMAAPQQADGADGAPADADPADTAKPASTEA